MQGDLLYPTIFNLVIDAFIRHWLTVVIPTEAGTGGLGLTIIDLTAYFYTDDGLVESTQSEMLQRAFDVFTDLFDRFSLRKNRMNTVGMVFQPCQAPRGMLEEAYAR